MPTPEPKESEKEFIDRCIPVVMAEGGHTQEQAAGKCYGIYRQYRQAARKRGRKGK